MKFSRARLIVTLISGLMMATLAEAETLKVRVGVIPGDRRFAAFCRR